MVLNTITVKYDNGTKHDNGVKHDNGTEHVNGANIRTVLNMITVKMITVLNTITPLTTRTVLNTITVLSNGRQKMIMSQTGGEGHSPETPLLKNSEQQSELHLHTTTHHCTNSMQISRVFSAYILLRVCGWLLMLLLLLMIIDEYCTVLRSVTGCCCDQLQQVKERCCSRAGFCLTVATTLGLILVGTDLCWMWSEPGPWTFSVNNPLTCQHIQAPAPISLFDPSWSFQILRPLLTFRRCRSRKIRQSLRWVCVGVRVRDPHLHLHHLSH